MPQIPAPGHGDLHRSRTQLWLLNVLDPEILAGVESCCFHGVSPSHSRPRMRPIRLIRLIRRIHGTSLDFHSRAVTPSLVAVPGIVTTLFESGHLVRGHTAGRGTRAEAGRRRGSPGPGGSADRYLRNSW